MRNLLVLAVMLALPFGAPAETLDSARRADLMHLLKHDCGSCHGMTLKGGLGVPLLPATLDGKDDAALAALILDGVPDTPMPPWRGQLNEAEAAWLVQQMKKGVVK